MKPNDLPPELGPGPFTIAAAYAAGVSRQTLRGRRFSAPHRGVRVLASGPDDDRTPEDRQSDQWTKEQRAADERLAQLRAAVDAARLVLPADSLATGVTGLRLFGVEVGTTRPLRFVTAHPRQVRRPGLRVTRVAVTPTAWDGASTGDGTAAVPEHCWMAAALELDLVELVTAGDWLLRLRFTSRPQLAAYVQARSGRGCRASREAVGLLRDRVDSVRESRLRMCLVLAGLPTPDCNPTIRGRKLRARVDLVYKEFRILIEYEGDQHRTDKRQWNTDIDRQEDFAAGDWVVYRVTADRARHPRRIVERVHTLLVEAGYDGPAPVFDARWCRLFE